MEEIRDNDIRITYSYEEGIGNAEILVYDPVQLTMKIPTLKYGSIYANNFLSIYIQDRLKVF